MSFLHQIPPVLSISRFSDLGSRSDALENSNIPTTYMYYVSMSLEE